jgi:ATP-dependent helicase HrpA
VRGESLTQALTTHLKQLTGVDIPQEAWAMDRLPEHLKMNFCVVDAKGRTLAEGRNLEALQRQLGQQVATAFRNVQRWPIERNGVTQWDFGELPKVVETGSNGLALRGFPALVNKQSSVSIQVFDTEEEALGQGRAGLRRLFMLALPQQLKYLHKSLLGLNQMTLHYAAVDKREQLVEDLVQAVFDQTFVEAAGDIRNAAEFNRRLEQGRARLVEEGSALAKLAGEILERFHAIQRALNSGASKQRPEVTADIREQIDNLVYPGFITATPAEWLRQLPRYLKAILLRLEKCPRDPARDQQRAASVKAFWESYKVRVAAKPSPGLVQFRWMLEEFRVSLFAQELGTLKPVSETRLAKLWEEVSK